MDGDRRGAKESDESGTDARRPFLIRRATADMYDCRSIKRANLAGMPRPGRPIGAWTRLYTFVRLVSGFLENLISHHHTLPTSYFFALVLALGIGNLTIIFGLSCYLGARGIRGS
jgi:hypothetical protein